MKYTTHATVAGKPKVHVRANTKPIEVRGGMGGEARARIGQINARVGRVPIMLAIPFLGGLRMVGSAGPFDLHTEPIDVEIERFELHCDCVLGPDGLSGELDGNVDCNWKIDAHGRIPGRVSLEFDDDDEDDD